MIRSLLLSAVCLATLTAFGSAVQAAEVTVPHDAQPESITVAPDGSLILGSSSSPKIYRAKKGSSNAGVFIDLSSETPKGTILGVLADAASNTLWACQINDGPPAPGRKTTLRGFDLKTGVPKFRWPLPGDANLCNDFAVGPDHALYVTDTLVGKIWRVKRGAKEGELLIEDLALLGIDGITFLNGTLYVNNVFSDNLYRIPLDATGKAGKPFHIWVDQPMNGPDGMRSANGRLFVAENGSGRISMITIHGDKASATKVADGFKMPTAVQPAGDTLWMGDRGGDKAVSVRMPK
jgi:hypothetical protein